MEQMADRHMLSRNYIKWKIKCDMEQKNGVASLHYKYGSNLHCLLYKNSVFISLLINRFRVAMHLVSNWTQLTSNFDKKKKVAREAQQSVSLHSYHILTSTVIYYRTKPQKYKSICFVFCHLCLHASSVLR